MLNFKINLINNAELASELINGLKLTKYEVKVYLTLVNYDSLTVSEVSKISGVPRPKCYEILRSLESKGLITRIYTVPMKYQALPVDIAFKNRLTQLKEELQRRIEDAERAMRKIKAFSDKVRTKGREIKVIFLEEHDVIMTYAMTDVAKAKLEVLTAISSSPVYHEWRKYFNEIKEALDRGVILKFLVPSLERFNREVSRVKELRKFIEMGNFRVKKAHILRQPFSVIDEKISYIYLTDPIQGRFLSAIRIEDDIFSAHMKTIFELIWNYT